MWWMPCGRIEVNLEEMNEWGRSRVKERVQEAANSQRSVKKLAE